MMRWLISLALLLPSVASAGDLDSVPIFYSALGSNPKYQDAASKAQQAFLIQSGIGPNVDKFDKYMANEASTILASAVGDTLPLKDIYAVVGTAYMVGVKKQISRSFRNPLLPKVTNSVSIDQQSATIGACIFF